METKKVLHIVAFVLVIIGGINWGIFGLFNRDVVEILFGGVPTLVEAVYVLVGASAVYLAFTHIKECKLCMQSGK